MSDGTSEAKKEPKRSVRKRASVKSAVSKADANSATPRKRATRKRATRTSRTARKPVEKKVAPKAEAAPTVVPVDKEKNTERKAPTPLASLAEEKKANRIRATVVAVLLVIGIGSSAVVGYTDQGAININEVIESRNERIRTTGSTEQIVASPNTNQLPDGGLVGARPSRGRETAPVPDTDVATSSTSTDETVAGATEDESAEEEGSDAEVEEESETAVSDDTATEPVDNDAATSSLGS